MRLQDKVSQKVFVLEKAGTDNNLADALIKGVDANDIQYHLDGVKIEIRIDRHPIAPALEETESSAAKKLSDEG